jgi:hypothetical protein
MSPADVPEVTTATFAVAFLDPFNVTELGVKAQVDYGGVPLQLSMTVWLNPLSGNTVNV